MGFRFRKRIKLGKLISLNVGKSGVTSMSVGKPGLTLNVNKNGVKTTVGLPGTGLSYSTNYSSKKNTDTNHNTNDCAKYYCDKTDNKFISESTRRYVMWWFLAIPFVAFFAAANKDMANFAGIALFGSLGFIFIRQQMLNFNKWAYEKNRENELIRLAKISAQYIWYNLTAQNIVECVNLKYGTCFIEDNLVSSCVDDDDWTRYNVTLFCGGQTVKTSTGFVRNKNIRLVLTLSDVNAKQIK